MASTMTDAGEKLSTGSGADPVPHLCDERDLGRDAGTGLYGL